MPDLRDPETFRRLYEEHAGRVRASAQRVLGDRARAEDVAQEVFLRLWREPASWRPERGSIETYLCMMARSRAIDLWRSEHAAQRACERLASLAGPPAAPDPADATAGRPDRATIVRALRELPPAQREAVVLAYWGGLSTSEVARRTRVPLGTAKGRLRLAAEKLAGPLAAAA